MLARAYDRRRISLDPIFGHSGDTRIAASVTLAGMISILIAGAALSLGLPLKHTPKFPARDSTAAAAPSGPVRVVGATASAPVPCEQQTWPYINQRCLIRTEAKPRPDDTPTQQSETTGSAPLDVSAPQKQNAINAPPPPEPIIGNVADDAEAMPMQRVVAPVRRTRANRHHEFPIRFGGFFRLF